MYISFDDIICSSGGSCKLQTKSEEYTENNTYTVSPDAGYDGLSKVDINIAVPEKKIEANKTQSITTNGETVITPTAGNDGMAQVTVDVNVPQTGGTGIDFSSIGYDSEENSKANASIEESIAIPYSRQKYDEWNPENTSAENLYVGDKKLVYAPKIDTSNVTDFSYMFSQCSSLVNVPNLNTSNGINFSSMFDACKSLINIPDLDTSNGIDFSNMFPFCTLVELPNFNTSKGTNFYHMFYGCDKLTTVPELDMSNATDAEGMFARHILIMNLTNLGGFVGLKVDLDLSTNPLLTKESLLNVINKMADLTGQTSPTLTLGSTNLAKLTDDEKAIATGKNWILA